MAEMFDSDDESVSAALDMMQRDSSGWVLMAYQTDDEGVDRDLFVASNIREFEYVMALGWDAYKRERDNDLDKLARDDEDDDE